MTLADIPQFGSQFNFAPVSNQMSTIAEDDRPPHLRRWYFRKLNRPDTIVLVTTEDKIETYGEDALKLAITIGRRVEYMQVFGVSVPIVAIPKSQESDLVNYCQLFRCDIDIIR